MKSYFAAAVFYIHPFPSSDAFVPGVRNNILSSKNPQILTMAEGNNESGKSSCSKKTNSNGSTSKSKRLYSFEEARRIARGHGFDSKEEFLDYMCPGAYQIPKDADVVWAESWNGWEDFLGITLTFYEGREVARGLEGINSEEAYMALMKSKTIPDDSISSRLPFRPDLKYKEQWHGWKDFLVG
jgi:hypothetical protein